MFEQPRLLIRGSATSGALKRTAVHRLARFRKDEGGALIIFGLMLFVVMLMVAGMAVDVMHVETIRTRLQDTADSATLAAANLDQTLTPASVVNDYFTKAGLHQYLDDVTVTSTRASRTVSAKAQADVPSIFMQFVGIDKLIAPAKSTATESVHDVEISLVLDVSASMGGDRLIKLQDAANKFVDRMFDAVGADHLSISIVPYSDQVLVDPDLFSYFYTTQDHNHSHCINFSHDSFKETGMYLMPKWSTVPLGTMLPMVQSGYYDMGSSSDTLVNFSAEGKADCVNDSDRYILPFSNDSKVLKDKINALKADGFTSIDLGMKWGVGLLDPLVKPIVTDMISKGKRSANLAGRPFAYNDRTSTKVIVLMTDGQNMPTWFLRRAWATGPSTMFDNSADPYNFSYYDKTRGENPYFWTSDATWHKNLYTAGGGTATHLTWAELWARVPIPWYIKHTIIAISGDKNVNVLGPMFRWSVWPRYASAQIDPSLTQDGQLLSQCDAAKNKYVTVYTIGFATGEYPLLSKCATTPSYFYDVDGLNIASAFASIASSINKLRLTQ